MCLLYKWCDDTKFLFSLMLSHSRARAKFKVHRCRNAEWVVANQIKHIQTHTHTTAAAAASSSSSTMVLRSTQHSWVSLIFGRSQTWYSAIYFLAYENCQGKRSKFIDLLAHSHSPCRAPMHIAQAASMHNCITFRSLTQFTRYTFFPRLYVCWCKNVGSFTRELPLLFLSCTPNP